MTFVYFLSGTSLIMSELMTLRDHIEKIDNALNEDS